MSLDVVLVGEALISMAGPPDRPLDRGTSMDLTFAGAEVNVAVGLARLGRTARWLSAVGDDPFGRMVIRGLRGEGVDTSGVTTSTKGPTALMIKNRRPGGEPEVFYYRAGSAMSQTDASTFPDQSWSDAKVLYLTGITPALSKNCKEMILNLVDQAFEQGIEIWLDPNHRRKLWSDQDSRDTLLPLLPKISLFSVGLSEGEILVGTNDPSEIAARLTAQGATKVIVKAGADGTWFFDNDQMLHTPAFQISSVIDAVGAGDGFAAGVLAGYLEGLPWEASLQRGNAVGAMVCQTKGDWEGLPNLRELDDFLSMRTEAVR